MKKILFLFSFLILIITTPNPASAAAVGPGQTCGILNHCDPDQRLTCVDPGLGLGGGSAVCMPEFSRSEGQRCDNGDTIGGRGIEVCKKGLTCVAEGGDTYRTCKKIDSTDRQQPAPSPPCKKFENGTCAEFNTALGTFKTEPSDFVVSVFGFLISMAGGIAILLIMIAGYKIMTSRGNPDQIQQAREQMIAAIVGLMFLIFSFLFLQLIGIDILKVPGLESDQGVPTRKSCDVAGNDQCPSGQTCKSNSGGRDGTCR